MKKGFRLALYRWLRAMGFDPRATLHFFCGIMQYIKDYFHFIKNNKKNWPVAISYPCFDDKSDSAGTARGHYFHQDLLVAQLIYKRGPRRHVDVGSRVDGFVAHIASFREIEVLDIRPMNVAVRNIRFAQANMMDAGAAPSACCDSLSCLHALEHFGLGRYGDPVEVDGWRKGLFALTQLLESGGILYLSVPIGRQRVEFNGHRIFSPDTIINAAEEAGLVLNMFHHVDDFGDLHRDQATDESSVRRLCELRYGCGIFEFIKRK